MSISKFILDEEYRAAGYAEPFPPMPRAHAKKLEKILKPASAIGTATEKMNVDQSFYSNPRRVATSKLVVNAAIVRNQTVDDALRA